MVPAMADTLYALPASFSAGTTVEYRRQLSDYPASGGWTLKLYLAGAKILTTEATADGADHLITIEAEDTAGLLAGVYKWVERVSKTVDGTKKSYDVASGAVTVTADLAQATDGSEQEWAEQAITVLQAYINRRLPSGMESYQINGRTVTSLSIPEARKELASLRAELARVANPGRVFRGIPVTFTETGSDQ